MKAKRNTMQNFKRLNTMVAILALSLLLQCPSIVSSQPCSVCPNGEPIELPDVTFEFEGAPVEDCATLATAAVIFETSNPFCDTIHRISSLCGCSYDEEAACSLCHDGSPVSFPLNPVPGFMADDYLFGAPPNVTLNCETMEAILHQEAKDTATCRQAQVTAANVCGCIAPPPPSNDDEEDSVTGEEPSNPSELDGQDDADEEGNTNQACTVCMDGEPISQPDTPLKLDGFPITKCGDLSLFAVFLPRNSTECIGLQSVGTYCGCTMRTSDFTLCASGEALPDPERRITWLDEFNDIPETFQPLLGSLTCGIFEAILQNYDDSFINLPMSYIHFIGRLKSYGCGCDADWRAKLFIASYRFSGSLSLLGSLIICLDVLLTKKKRKSTYHQIVLVMSIYDMISSMAYLASSSFAPRNSGIYQAAGTKGTCKLQGFMIQLGLTSIMFNAILAVYFYLMVNQNWKERVFVKFRHWVYLGAAVLGIAMAVGGLWFYESLAAICYVAQPPLQSWLPLTLLFTVPMSITLVIGTISILLVCHKVYSIEWKAMRWSARGDARLSKKVLRQTLLYMMSLYVTVPWLLLSFYARGEWAGYWTSLIGGIMIPLQGFLNLFVYCNRENTILLNIQAVFLGKCKSFYNKVTTVCTENRVKQPVETDGGNEFTPSGGTSTSAEKDNSNKVLGAGPLDVPRYSRQLQSETDPTDIALSRLDLSARSTIDLSAMRRHTFDPHASVTAVQEFLSHLDDDWLTTNSEDNSAIPNQRLHRASSVPEPQTWLQSPNVLHTYTEENDYIVRNEEDPP